MSRQHWDRDATVMARRPGHLAHWAAGPHALTTAWHARSAAARALLPAQPTSVLDLGCYDGYLGTLLPPTCLYIPVDLLPRALPGGVQWDLNCGTFPRLPACEALVATGVLEFLTPSPRACLAWARTCAHTFVFSWREACVEAVWDTTMFRAQLAVLGYHLLQMVPGQQYTLFLYAKGS